MKNEQRHLRDTDRHHPRARRATVSATVRAPASRPTLATLTLGRQPQPQPQLRVVQTGPGFINPPSMNRCYANVVLQMMCNNPWVASPCLSFRHRGLCASANHSSTCYMCVLEMHIYDYWAGRKKEMSVDFYRLFREEYPDLRTYSQYTQEDPQGFYDAILRAAEQCHTTEARQPQGKA